MSRGSSVGMGWREGAGRIPLTDRGCQEVVSASKIVQYVAAWRLRHFAQPSPLNILEASSFLRSDLWDDMHVGLLG